MQPIYRLLFIACCAVLGACSSAPTVRDQGIVYDQSESLPLDSSENEARLNEHYAQWRGTPYRMGGLSSHGVDCSGFVFITYRDVFGVILPRTTEQQARVGETVPRRALQFGDLVVFKTGFKQRHVGVYVGEGAFIHASSSRGVIKSHIRDPYWADAYRLGRRVAAAD